MADVRSAEKGGPTTARAVELSAYVVSLHGFALLVVWRAPWTTRPVLSLAVSAACLLPFVLFVRGGGSPGRRAFVALGLLPSAWLAASAFFEALSPAVSSPFDALRTAAGLFAHLGAAFELAALRESRRAVLTSPHVRSSPAGPVRRQRLRTALLAALCLPLALAVLVTPQFVPAATRFERAFAAVAGTVLATSLVLTILPPVVRKERRAPKSVGNRVLAASIAVGVAALALLLERTTR